MTGLGCRASYGSPPRGASAKGYPPKPVIYLSSLPPDPERILKNTRSHWAIENTLHWILDMSFGEDACRIRKDNAPLALSTIRHVVLNLLQATKQSRESIKGLKKKAGWDNTVLKRILNLS